MPFFLLTFSFFKKFKKRHVRRRCLGGGSKIPSPLVDQPGKSQPNQQSTKPKVLEIFSALCQNFFQSSPASLGAGPNFISVDRGRVCNLAGSAGLKKVLAGPSGQRKPLGDALIWHSAYRKNFSCTKGAEGFLSLTGNPPPRWRHPSTGENHKTVKQSRNR